MIARVPLQLGVVRVHRSDGVVKILGMVHGDDRIDQPMHDGDGQIFDVGGHFVGTASLVFEGNFKGRAAGLGDDLRLPIFTLFVVPVTEVGDGLVRDRGGEDIGIFLGHHARHHAAHAEPAHVDAVRVDVVHPLHEFDQFDGVVLAAEGGERLAARPQCVLSPLLGRGHEPIPLDGGGGVIGDEGIAGMCLSSRGRE